ncbi:hypothetical protein AVEN_35173-1 [Araneus ventricosus]|uniref:Uncharacterized protein n=1 Tax=Araneus ventricosus TaxID=182803 RepID=A0A4Y2GUK4_ARAVE|nr:hypothetical protein AVEN_35173-1 [Araneus ventricosus]
MMPNILSDLSGTSLSIAREKSRPFRGARYQGVGNSARWGIEGVPWWRSSDFLWPQLRANVTAPGQRMMNKGTQLFRHEVPLESKPSGWIFLHWLRQACESGYGLCRLYDFCRHPPCPAYVLRSRR